MAAISGEIGVLSHSLRKKQERPSPCFYLRWVQEYAAGISLVMISSLASASIPVLWHVSIGMYVNTSEMGVWAVLEAVIVCQTVRITGFQSSLRCYIFSRVYINLSEFLQKCFNALVDCTCHGCLRLAYCIKRGKFSFFCSVLHQIACTQQPKQQSLDEAFQICLQGRNQQSGVR